MYKKIKLVLLARRSQEQKKDFNSNVTIFLGKREP